MEDYKKKYEEALERAKSYQKFNKSAAVTAIFPELAESEDEKMFKAISEGIRDEAEVFGWSDFGDIPIDDILAWLEKQREKTSDKIVEKARTEKQRVLLTETDGSANIDWDCRSINDVKILLKCGLEFIRNIESNKQILTDDRFGGCSFRVPTRYDKGINQGEQKLTDKVEPKFKIEKGRWYVCIRDLDDNYGTRAFCKDSIYYSTKDETLLPGNSNIPFEIKYCANDYFRLWTIQDAKDGDVLYTSSTASNEVFIFKGLTTEGYIECYCSYDSEDKYCEGKYHFIGELTFNTHPATKEQRKLLFQKIEESGYKWENNQLVKISNQLKEINTKGFVDLGLPSGTLWAKCNLGAEKETDFGLYYQWGTTKGYKGVDEHQFDWNDYKFGSWDNFNENNTKLILDNEDDPVLIATNGEQITPTKEQLQELINYTNHEWTNIDGVKGMKFINKNDDSKYIFIPAAGYCYAGNQDGGGYWGSVWSASRDESIASRAWRMGFDTGYVGMFDTNRCIGYPVRGVMNK